MTNHPYHLVTPSPWPIIISFSIFNNFIYMINWFNNISTHNYYSPSLISFILTLICMFLWWMDITRESTFQGCHTILVKTGLQIGMILFIISELFFFISFFWAYFHSSLAPSIEIGQIWPPKGIIPFNPLDIPLLNTIILISSGFTVTWSHYSMMNKNIKESMLSLFMTISLGLYFTFLQLIEYFESPFTISDSIYGSTFFIATGFHGLHVIIGSLFLLFTFFRMKLLHLSPNHHFGFEAATWYWHFVDVIWLFLYISIYWWSF